MLTVPTALLLHRTRECCHHDWLVGTPAYHTEPESRLWTARVGPGSRQWRGLGCFLLEPIPPHRRVYLDYQGPVSGDRGMVVRVDRGTAVIHLWSRERIVWRMRMSGFDGEIDARRLSSERWRANVTA